MQQRSHLELLGIEKSTVINLLGNIEKMAWEQFLLLAFYTRQQLSWPDHASHIGERFEALRIILDAGQSKNTSSYQLSVQSSYRHLFDALQNGDSSNAFYMHCHKHRGARVKITEAIESEGVLFPKLKNRLPYPIGAMYQSVKQPVYVMKCLLKLDRLKNELDRFTIKMVTKLQTEYVIDNNLHIAAGPDLTPEQTKQFAIFLFSQRPELYTHIKEQYLEQFSSHVLDIINDVFNALSVNIEHTHNEDWITSLNGFPQSHFSLEYSKKAKSHREDIYRDIERKTIITLIDQNHLRGLLDIGQKEEAQRYIFQSVLDKMGRLDDGYMNKSKSRYELLEDVTYWYKRHKTDLITRSDQIPRLAAALLQYDITYHIGENAKITKQLGKLNKQAVYQLVGCLIHNCFINHAADNEKVLLVPDEMENSDNGFKISELEDYIYNNDLPSHASMMEPWAKRLCTATELDQSLLDKFKKLPFYLKVRKGKQSIDGNELMIKKIIKQRQGSAPYPVDERVPMPLWFMGRS